MSEQEQISQLSALFDGELPPQQAQMVIRRALKDPALRTSWERYALIGACLRNEPLSARVSVAERVQARLAAERELNVTVLPVRNAQAQAGGSRFSLFGRGALGGAIAAGVAMVVISVVRQMGPAAPDAGVQLAQSPAAAADLLEDVLLEDPAGYTTPGQNAPVQRRLLDASLSHYLVAHSEEAASALRSSYDLALEGTELTEDQIIALR